MTHNRSGYTHRKCRCAACRKAQANYMRRYNRQRREILNCRRACGLKETS